MIQQYYSRIKNRQSGLKPFNGVAFITPALRPGFLREVRSRWALALIGRTIMIKKLFIVAVLLFLISTAISAQSKQETAVSNAVEKLRTAMISGERAELETIAADQLSYGHSSGLVETKTQFVEKIASGQSDFVSIEFKNQTISISKKTAIVRHELHATNNDNGKPGEVHLKILLVWQKQSGQWKLLARQAVKIP